LPSSLQGAEERHQKEKRTLEEETKEERALDLEKD